MDRRRRSATVKKPLGPEISAAECAELHHKTLENPSKRISRADGTRRVQEYFTSGALDGGMSSVPFKRLSLLCPITNKRIVDPARGVNCTHLECFDVSAYLDSQTLKPFWDCPICQKPLPADDLRIDEFTSFVLRVELDAVQSVELCADGSHRVVKQSEPSRANQSHQARPGDDAIILDDEPMAIDNEDQETTESDPLATLPLSLLVNFGRQTKDLLRRMPVKKGKRKADEPTDLLEEHHEALRNLIKQARATVASDGTMRLPVTLQDEALVNDNDELRVQNEELASQNSALLAENLRLNRRLAELEQNHANGRPNLRFTAGTRKNTVEVLMWLDRFSLDAVQFGCTFLKTIVDVYLPMSPIRVLKSVVFDWFEGCYAKLVARCARKSFGMTLDGDDDLEKGFRRMFARCFGCAIEYFEMMKGLESVYISGYAEAVTDETMKVCEERGVASLNTCNGNSVSDEALLGFCFSNTPINGDAAGRTLFMKFHETPATKPSLSKNFFVKLVKKCLDQIPTALPSVTLGCAVDTTSYDAIGKTHASQLWKCAHFQLEASGEKFEIVVRKTQYGPSDLIVRKGHTHIGECIPERYLCEWEGSQIYI